MLAAPKTEEEKFYSRELRLASVVDLSSFFIQDACDFIKSEGGVDISELPDEKQMDMIVNLIFLWVNAKKEPAVVDGWLQAAQDFFGPEITITNGWHDGSITCWCSKCNGRVVDTSKTIQKILKAA